MRIDKNVPFPKERGFLSRILSEMNVGDSIRFSKAADAYRFVNNSSGWRMRRGYMLALRSFEDGSARVWLKEICAEERNK